ncbi:MAG: type II secretion system protein [Candidatus Saccharimonadales bacterium]
MNVPRNKENGFTIIEVVLVLAIAALIFLMVFIALPALQRSQRDTQRKDDVARVQTAINSYQSNNRNALPTNYATFITNYLRVGGDQFQDPDGTAYTLSAAAVPTTFTSGAMRYVVNAKCVGEVAQTGAGAAKIAILYKLEGGGVVCVNN